MNSHVLETTNVLLFYTNYRRKPRFRIEPHKPIPAMTTKALVNIEFIDRFAERIIEVYN